MDFYLLLFNKYYTSNEKDEFDSVDAVLASVNFHNNTIHSTTKYKSIALREITDLKIFIK